MKTDTAKSIPFDMKLMQGDCLELMKSLPDSSVDLVLTDPPYFRVKKGESWDMQWAKPANFLAWLDKCVEQWARVMKPNGSLYCFASPQMAARVEVMIRERLNVLNNIRWLKAGENIERRHVSQIVEKGLARTYLPSWEACIFAEHYGADNIAKGEAGYQAKCDELRGFVFEPLRGYLDHQRERCGMTPEDCNDACGHRRQGGMAGRHYFSRSQFCLPTAKNYEKLRHAATARGFDCFTRRHKDLKEEYAELWKVFEGRRSEYEDLRREYEDLRRPFTVSKDVPYTDVWTFEPVRPHKGKHPCEKPLDMLEHIITASSREGATVLDSFMGTGNVGIACKKLGRHFLGMELDAGYFATACDRIEKYQNIS